MNKIRNAKYQIGQVVRHRLFPFRGVVFDIDPIFSNTEEWYESIPAEVRPHKDQPFYHLFAENDETEYIAYVSEQNLLPDNSGEPVRHPQVAEVFVQDGKGGYRPAPIKHALIACGTRRAAHMRRRRAFDAAVSACPRAYWVLPAAGGAAEEVGAPCWLSSFLRASSARRCSSSCSFFCCSSKTLGSVGGPS